MDRLSGSGTGWIGFWSSEPGYSGVGRSLMQLASPEEAHCTVIEPNLHMVQPYQVNRSRSSPTLAEAN